MNGLNVVVLLCFGFVALTLVPVIVMLGILVLSVAEVMF